MKIYLDSCCYGRPWDGKDQASIVAEANAIGEIIDWRFINGHITIGSPIVKSEILRNPRPDIRAAVMEYFLESIDEYVYLATADYARARVLRKAGLRRKDHYHLAAAECAGADMLLTVDKGFLQVATSRSLSKVQVINPLSF
jgi:hypothetical protein